MSGESPGTESLEDSLSPKNVIQKNCYKLGVLGTESK